MRWRFSLELKRKVSEQAKYLLNHTQTLKEELPPFPVRKY
jgi:hypothetical protein